MNRTAIIVIAAAVAAALVLGWAIMAQAVVPSTLQEERYGCNGATTAFVFHFGVWETSEVVAERITVATGAVATLLEGSDYTVGLPNGDGWLVPGGTVTTTATYSSAYNLLLRRVPPLTQGSTWSTVTTFRPATLEADLDKAVVRDLYLQAQIRRALRGPTDEDSDMNLPAAPARAGTRLGFDQAGNVYCYGGLVTLDLANDEWLSVPNAAGDGWLRLVIGDANDHVRLGPGVRAYAAPADGNEVANKAYVDAQVGGVNTALATEHLLSGGLWLQRQGSARIWYDPNDGNQPSLAPGGARALGLADRGELWADPNLLVWIWTGTGWLPAGANDVNVAVTDFIDANEITDPMVRLTSTGWLRARNAGGTADVGLLRADANDDPQLGPNAVTYSTAAPTADAHVANKKYVDDQVTAHTGLGAATTTDTLGAGLAKTNVYRAQSDGILTVIGPQDNDYTIVIYVDATSPPTTAWAIGQVTGTSGNEYRTISAWAAADEYVKVTYDQSGSPTIRWRPYGGTGGLVKQ
jgi:hypothetical protein